MSTKLLDALRAADPATPASLDVFDRVAGSAAAAPDLQEFSLRAGDRGAPRRLTYYFDTHRRGAAVARETGERFAELTRELGLTLPPPLAAFVRSTLPGGREVLQVVLGIDAAEGALRAKYYLVFRDDPAACVAALLGEPKLAPAPGVDLAKTCIVGVDVGETGILDVKLYFHLDANRVPALLEDPTGLRELLAKSRDVVFQQCTRRPERRQLYLHASDTRSLVAWLARSGFDAVLGRAESVGSHLRGARVDPWIVSFPYGHRRTSLEDATVYFHVSTTGQEGASSLDEGGARVSS